MISFNQLEYSIVTRYLCIVILFSEMSDRQDCSGDENMKFKGIYKSLDAVKDFLRGEKVSYFNLSTERLFNKLCFVQF